MDKTRSIEVIRRDADDPRIANTLALAFQNDPALAWLLPDPAIRARRLGQLFAVLEKQSLRAGQVLASHGREAVVLEYPAGAVHHGFWPDISDNLATARVLRSALGRGLRLAGAIHAHHPDPQPHVYLRFVGVRPDAQGSGWGSAIIRACVDRAAAQRRGVLLETATPENVGLYARLGFDIVSEWDAPEDGPRFWTMIREFGD